MSSEITAAVGRISKLLRDMLSGLSHESAAELERIVAGVNGSSVSELAQYRFATFARRVLKKEPGQRLQPILDLLRVAPNLHVENYAKKFGVDLKELQRLVWTERLTGTIGFPTGPHSTRTSEQLRAALLDAIRNPNTHHEIIAQRHGISKTWVSEMDRTCREALGMPARRELGPAPLPVSPEVLKYLLERTVGENPTPAAVERTAAELNITAESLRALIAQSIPAGLPGRTGPALEASLTPWQQ